MQQYLDLLQNIKTNGRQKGDRTGTGTISLFGEQMRFDLKDGFPLVTTKKVHYPAIIHELLWMISGDTNVKYLQDNGVRIWNEWADKKGDLGPVYGAQWRNWNGEGIDQLKDAIDRLKSNPDCRRIIVNAWNPSVLPDISKSFDENVANGKAALPPCHSFFQFYAQELTFIERLELLHEKGVALPKGVEQLNEAFKAENIPSRMLSLKLYQRSADVFLGVPFNIAFYAMLLEIVAKEVNMVAGDFVHTFGDVHIYNNHIEQIDLQLTRKPMQLPKLWLNPDVKSIFDYKFDDIKILDYVSHPAIKGQVSI